MYYKTPDEIRESLNSNISVFVCIGRPKRNSCREELEDLCKVVALRLLAEYNATLSRETLYDLLTLVLCAACQHTYTQKKNIRNQWMVDAPEIGPGEKRCRSPFSLHSRTPESLSKRLAALRQAAGTGSPTSSGGRSQEAAPSSPTEDALHRRNARHDPSNVTRPLGTSKNDITMAGAETGDILNTNNNIVTEGLPSQPSRTNAIPRESGNNAFSVGERSTWAPWTLRSEVLRILFKPLPYSEGKGSIYVVEDTNTPYVKIGVTKREVRTRLQEIGRTHRIQLRIGGEKPEDDIPLSQLCRLEKLVHADLAFFQLDLTVQEATSRRKRQEYFDVDLATAERTITMWWTIMQSIGVEWGAEIDQSIKESVRNAIRNIDVPPAGVSRADPEWWKTVNGNHEHRLNIWSSAFKLRDGGFTKSRVDRAVSRLTCAALALCVLYSSRLPYWVKNVTALFLWLAGSLYTMDTRSSDGCIACVIKASTTVARFVASPKGLARLTM